MQKNFWIAGYEPSEVYDMGRGLTHEEGRDFVTRALSSYRALQAFSKHLPKGHMDSVLFVARQSVINSVRTVKGLYFIYPNGELERNSY